MASINISEEDFAAVAWAARDAKRDCLDEVAGKLDKIARKMNAALTNARVSALSPFGARARPITWEEMPSTFDAGA